MSSLRERRRRQTAASIHQAALRLATERGADAVTVEAICAEAGVSVRTFFNYFSFKEAAFTISPPPVNEEAVSTFVSDTGLDGLIDLILSQMTHVGEDRRSGRVLRDIAANHPRIFAMNLSKFHEFEAELAGLIARRFGEPDADSRCRVLAAAVIAATRAAFDEWLESERGDARTALRSGLSHLRLLARGADQGADA